MSNDEHLDPIPDSFILQPPVFHPVSKLNKKTTNQLNSNLQVRLPESLPIQFASLEWVARRMEVDCCEGH